MLVLLALVALLTIGCGSADQRRMPTIKAASRTLTTKSGLTPNHRRGAECKKWKNTPASLLDLVPSKCLTSKQRAAVASSIAKANDFIQKQDAAAAENAAADATAHTEAATCNSLPLAIDRGNCRLGYEVCWLDAEAKVRRWYAGGPTPDTVAIRWAKGYWSSSGNWQPGYGGCLGALLAEAHRLNP